MDSNKKISRGEFLGALGGMAFAAIALKFASIGDTVTAVLPRSVTSADTGSTYGQSSYGGKNA